MLSWVGSNTASIIVSGRELDNVILDDPYISPYVALPQWATKRSNTKYIP